MPFESRAQQRFMFATMPEKAKEWAHETANIKDLPEKKHPQVNPKRRKLDKSAADGMFFRNAAPPESAHFFRDHPGRDDATFHQKTAGDPMDGGDQTPDLDMNEPAAPGEEAGGGMYGTGKPSPKKDHRRLLGMLDNAGPGKTRAAVKTSAAKRVAANAETEYEDEIAKPKATTRPEPKPEAPAADAKAPRVNPNAYSGVMSGKLTAPESPFSSPTAAPASKPAAAAKPPAKKREQGFFEGIQNEKDPPHGVKGLAQTRLLPKTEAAGKDSPAKPAAAKTPEPRFNAFGKQAPTTASSLGGVTPAPPPKSVGASIQSAAGSLKPPARKIGPEPALKKSKHPYFDSMQNMMGGQHGPDKPPVFGPQMAFKGAAPRRGTLQDLLEKNSSASPSDWEADMGIPTGLHRPSKEQPEELESGGERFFSTLAKPPEVGTPPSSRHGLREGGSLTMAGTAGPQMGKHAAVRFLGTSFQKSAEESSFSEEGASKRWDEAKGTLGTLGHDLVGAADTGIKNLTKSPLGMGIAALVGGKMLMRGAKGVARGTARAFGRRPIPKPGLIGQAASGIRRLVGGH